MNKIVLKIICLSLPIIISSVSYIPDWMQLPL